VAHCSVPIVVIACNVFQNFIEPYFPAGRVAKTVFLEYGLHVIPRNLKNAIQEQIDTVETPSLIMLGYGLCGNGLDGIQAGPHTLLIPRVDDCIALLLGSRQAYQQQFDHIPGTYYLSKGWLEAGSNPLNEYRKYVEQYGEAQANWLMDTQYRNYRRLALVAHTRADLEKYRPQAREVARYCARWGMAYEEILGSDAYVRLLMETAAQLDQAGDQFILVLPGGVLKQNQFLRG